MGARFQSRALFDRCIVFMVSLVVGLVINSLHPQHLLQGDEGDYFELASRFADTFQYGQPGQWAYRAPLYPLLLGIVFFFFPASLAAAHVLNSLLAAGMVVGAATLVQRYTHKRWPVYVSAVTMMLNSYWWLHQQVLMQENLAALLLVASVVMLPRWKLADPMRLVFRKHWRSLLASGTLFGLSQLAKPALIPMFLCLPFATMLLGPANNKRTQYAIAVAFLATSLLPVAPWALRNYLLLGEFVPFTTGSGEVFYGAHSRHMASDPGMWRNIQLPDDSRRQLAETDRIEFELLSSRLKWEAGLDEISRTPWSVLLRHFGMKVVRLWSPSTYFAADQVPPGIKTALVIWNTIVLAMFLYGVATCGPDRVIHFALIAALTTTALVFWGTIRFQYNLWPIIAALATVGLVQIEEKFLAEGRQNGDGSSPTE